MPAISQSDQLDQFSSGKEKLPAGINVLTILTFIGCLFSLYSAITSYTTGKESLDKFEESRNKIGDNSWMSKLFTPEAREMLVKSVENRIPLCILSVIGIALCIFGAIEMRKLKKQGFYLWLAGEILPYIGFFVFAGSVFFQTVYAYSLILPIIFIILYSMQLKYMK